MPELETKSIQGLELFSTGCYNGDCYDQRDLQAMVDAFEKVGFQPPVKAGHADGQEDEKKARMVFGAPALGYVQRIYLVGSKLVGDLVDVPKKFADLVKAGAYRRISSEIYWDYKDESTGAKWPRVLKAVSFLGADIPALTNLKAIESLYERDPASGLVFAYDAGGNQYRVYNIGIEEYRYPKKDKVSVNYENTSGREAERCSTCKFFFGGVMKCALVEGEISPQAICDLYEAREYKKMDENKLIAKFKETMESVLESFRTRRKGYNVEEVDGEFCVMQDGEKVKCYPTRAEAQAHMDKMKEMAGRAEAKTYTIEKRGDEWCLIGGDGKVLGCHDTRDKAVAQEQAVKAKSKMEKATCVCGAETHSEEGAMDQKEFEKKLAEEKAKIEAEFQAKLAESDKKAKEYETKATDAEKRAKDLADQDKKEIEARLAKVEAERKEERFEAWYSKTLAEGKIAPVERPRLKAIWDALPEGAMIVTYSKDEKEVKEPLWETVRGFIESRPSLFKTLSRNGPEAPTNGVYDQTNGMEIQEEVDRRVKEYIAAHKDAKYPDAMRTVLKEDPQLAEDYNRLPKQ